jgi:hypothetical protein
MHASSHKYARTLTQTHTHARTPTQVLRGQLTEGHTREEQGQGREDSLQQTVEQMEQTAGSREESHTKVNLSLEPVSVSVGYNRGESC